MFIRVHSMLIDAPLVKNPFNPFLSSVDSFRPNSRLSAIPSQTFLFFAAIKGIGTPLALKARYIYLPVGDRSGKGQGL